MLSTRDGYTGGSNDHATYRNHPGHAEAVEVVADGEVVDVTQTVKQALQLNDF